MKFLIGCLLMLTTGFFNLNQPKESSDSKERKVQVQVKYVNGESLTKEYTLTDFSASSTKIAKILNTSEVFECTVMFSNGECTVTASTCAAAQAGFRACACAAGHTALCVDENDNGGE